jgi:hypothetical protein
LYDLLELFCLYKKNIDRIENFKIEIIEKENNVHFEEVLKCLKKIENEKKFPFDQIFSFLVGDNNNNTNINNINNNTDDENGDLEYLKAEISQVLFIILFCVYLFILFNHFLKNN